MAVSIPLGTTFTQLPFPGTSTYTALQPDGFGDNTLSDSWAKGVLTRLLGCNRSFPLPIVFPDAMDIGYKTDKILHLYRKAEDITREILHPTIQTAFFDRLVFDDERNYFEVSALFFDKLAASGRMDLYVEHKNLIAFIVGITEMMKKQDALIAEFYSMSATSLTTRKTMPTDMLKSILGDIKKVHATPDARILINKIYFLAVNIDLNLQRFNDKVDQTSNDILEVIYDVFRPEGF